jgi:hypothetical protein
MFSEACQGPEKLMAWYVLIRPCLYKYVILDFSDISLPKVRFQSVAEAIKECCDDIDDYLKEDTWVHCYLLDYMSWLMSCGLVDGAGDTNRAAADARTGHSRINDYHI